MQTGYKLYFWEKMHFPQAWENRNLRSTFTIFFDSLIQIWATLAPDLPNPEQEVTITTTSLYPVCIQFACKLDFLGTQKYSLYPVCMQTGQFQD